jgi:hypothetical protein
LKNIAKGEDVIMENTDQTHAFVDEFLEEAMKSSNLYEAYEDQDGQIFIKQMKMLIMNIGHQTIMLMQHLE